MRRILTASATALALALALAGCSSLRALPRGPLGQAGPLALSQPSAAAPPADEVTCDREVPTGTRIAREVCRTRLEREHEQAEAEELLHLGLQHGEIIIR